MALEVSDRLKTIIKGLGFVLSLAAVGFVIWQFVQYWEEIELSGLGLSEWTALILMALGYALFSILLALAWWKMLLHLKTHSDLPWAIYAYGFSQLGKYLPGNVFHFAGRHVMGMAAGHSASKLLYSTVLELGLLIASGLLTTLLLLPLLGFHHLLAGLIYIATLLLLFVLLKYRTSIHLSHALLMHSLFLLVTGVLFVLIVALISDGITFDARMILLVLASYVVAWLSGLVVPGAPAGMGIRELVLLFLLGPWLSSSDLLLAVLLSRVVSLLGDLLFFAGVVLFKSRLTVEGSTDD